MIHLMTPPTSTDRRVSLSGRWWQAALASSLIPGLGQLLVGRRKAALIAVAPLAVILLTLLVLVTQVGMVGLAAQFTTPGRIAFLGVSLLVLIPWRILVVLDLTRGTQRTRRSIAVIAIALTMAIAPEVGGAGLAFKVQGAADDIFSGFETPTPSGYPSGSTVPTPEIGDRFTMLLIGADVMGKRASFNTDSMIIASWDRVGGWVSTTSIPRDIVNVPLGDGSIYPPKINSLWSYARRHPKDFPDGPAVALSTALGTLFHVHIDATALVIIPTFAQLIDEIGGIDVAIKRTIFDPGYAWHDLEGVILPAGNWHLDATCALAYARVRKAVGTNDFTRGWRQQQILISIRDQLAMGGNLLGKGLSLIDALGSGVRTNLDPAFIPFFAEAASTFDSSRVIRGEMQAGDGMLRYARAGESNYGSVIFFKPKGIELLATRLFPPAGTRPYSWPVAKGDPALGATPAPSGSSSPGTSPVPSKTPNPTPSSAPRPYPALGDCNAHGSKSKHTPPPDIVDADNDGITDDEDNCPDTANHDQADADADGIGNVCDTGP